MADTYTTNLNLTKPEPGAAEDTWGISLNADLDALDAIFGSGGTAVSMGAVTVDGLTVDTSTLVVDSTNKRVGIGTTSPSEDLHISGDTSVALIEGTNNATSGLVAGVKVKAQFYRRAGFSILDESDNEDFFIGRPYASTNQFVITNDGTERLRIDTAGNVGIGTSSPTVPLTVNNQTDHSDIAIFHAGGGTPNRGLKISTFSNVNANAGVELDAQTSTGAFKFSTGGTERMRLTSTGLGIGATPSYLLDVRSSTSPVVNIQGSDGNSKNIYFRKNTGDTVEGRIKVYADIMSFETGGSEAGRFDASQNFMVGKTSVGVSTTGSEIRANGQVSIVREGDTPLYINRKSSDGNVADFRKDNSTFGTISNSGTNLIISGFGTNKSGLYFGDNALFPVKNGSLSNSTIGFGSPNYRFTDLYLSGTAYANAVGIGISSPQGQLHINTESAEATKVYVDGEFGQEKSIELRHYNASEGSGVGRNLFYLKTPANDRLDIGGFTDGSSEFKVMTLMESGSVGIGTTSPDSNVKLDLNSGTNNVALGVESTDANVFIAMKDSGTTGTYGTAAVAIGANSDNLLFRAGSAEVGRFTSAGRFGINRTSPNGLLHMQSSSGTDSAFYIQTSAGTDDSVIYFGDDSSSTVGKILYAHSDNSMRFNTLNSEAMRIDSSGNVIIANSTKGLNDTDEGILFSGALPGLSYFTRDGGLAGSFSRLNSYGDVIRIVANGNAAGRIGSGGSGALSFYNGAGTTENMRIDSSGNVNIATGRLRVALGSDEGSQLNAWSESSGEANLAAYILKFKTGGNNSRTERMRIDSSGNLLVGTTSATGGRIITKGLANGSIYTIVSDQSPFGSSTIGHIQFKNSNGGVGSIQTSGSSTLYNTSSDYRLKDVTGQARGLDVINALNPVSYNWKADGKADEGLIAQEVAEIVPNAVSQNEDEYYQMDYSKLVVHLVKGMKEQQEQIEALQSEINLLKGE